MKIHIEYVAQMRSVAGIERETVELADAATALGAIRDAAGRHGGRLAELLVDSDGNLQPSALVFVDDEQLDPDADAALREGAKITVLAPLAGG